MGVVHDPAVHQMRGLISLENHIHAVPAVAVLEISGLQHAQESPGALRTRVPVCISSSYIGKEGAMKKAVTDAPLTIHRSPTSVSSIWHSKDVG